MRWIGCKLEPVSPGQLLNSSTARLSNNGAIEKLMHRETN